MALAPRAVTIESELDRIFAELREEIAEGFGVAALDSLDRLRAVVRVATRRAGECSHFVPRGNDDRCIGCGEKIIDD